MKTDAEAVAALTVLDWIGAIVAGVVVVALAAFPIAVAPSFAAMFRDFGADPETLPRSTRLVLTPWFPPAIALGPLFALIAGLRRSSPIAWRRLSFVAAFVLGGAGLAFCIYGVYQPIFETADAIRAH